MEGRADEGRRDEQASHSIGAYLAAQRRLRGIGLDELAELTRIPRRSLERLEAGAFDARPDGFSRGFVRTVAVAIGLDPDQTLNRMLPEPSTGPRRTVPGLRLAVWLLLVTCGLLGLGLGGWALLRAVSSPGSPSAESASLPVRRDAVRALALSRGLIPSASELAAPALAPTPGPGAPTSPFGPPGE